MARIVDVPLVYKVLGVPARSRNPQELKILDIVPVEVPEVRLADLPVALRFHGESNGFISAADNGFITTGQALAGADEIAADLAKRRLSTPGQDIDAFSAAVRHLGEGIGPREPTGLIKAFEDELGVNGAGVFIASHHADIGTKLRSVVRSDEEAGRQRFLDRIAPRLLIVDGRLVMLQSEPVWTVGHERALQARRSSSAHVFFNSSHSSDWTQSFRIDGFERAARFGAETAHRVDMPKVEVEDTGVVQWRFDEVAAATRSMAMWLKDCFGSSLANELMKEAPADFFVAWCALRDWQGVPPDRISEARETVMDHLSTLGDDKDYHLGLALTVCHRHSIVESLQPASNTAAPLDDLRI